MVPDPMLGGFGRVGGSGVLLKRPMASSEMLLSPRQKNFVENRCLIHFLVDFGATVQKNQGRFSVSSNTSPNHKRLRLLRALDDAILCGRLGCPYSVVVVIVSDFCAEEFFIRKQDASMPASCKPPQESSASFDSGVLRFVSQKLSFLHLVGLHAKVVFQETLDWSSRYSDGIGEFSC